MAAFLVAVVAFPGACRREAGTWTWQARTVDEALAAAAAGDRFVLVEVGASWCEVCHTLERDVFRDRPGVLPEGLVGVQVDFDAPEGDRIADRYHVMNLPTTLILDPTGAVRGRIEGFEDAPSYGEAVKRAVRGDAWDVEGAVRKADAAPGDAAAQVEAGATLLAAGREADGVARLERARALDGERKGAWRDATRTLGRYFERARADFDRALAYYREGADAGPGTDAGWGFRYSIARALHRAGRTQEARAYLDAQVAANSGDPRGLSYLATYLYTFEVDDTEAVAVARRARALDPADDWNWYLEAALLQRMDRRDEARAAVDEALKRAPGKALYEDLKKKM
jgi:hypothetical protein